MSAQAWATLLNEMQRMENHKLEEREITSQTGKGKNNVHHIFLTLHNKLESMLYLLA